MASMQSFGIYKLATLVARITMVGAIVFAAFSFVPDSQLLVARSSILTAILFIQYCSIPILWSLWLGCVIYADGGHRQDSKELIRLWATIDIATLIYFFAAWQGNHGFLAEKGADISLLVMFLPVVIPVGLVFGWVLIEVIEPVFNIHIDTSAHHGLGEIWLTWISLSTIAAAQSLLVTLIARYVKSRRVRAKAKTENVPYLS
jgi:hypothetical protein